MQKSNHLVFFEVAHKSKKIIFKLLSPDYTGTTASREQQAGHTAGMWLQVEVHQASLAVSQVDVYEELEDEATGVAEQQSGHTWGMWLHEAVHHSSVVEPQALW